MGMHFELALEGLGVFEVAVYYPTQMLDQLVSSEVLLIAPINWTSEWFLAQMSVHMIVQVTLPIEAAFAHIADELLHDDVVSFDVVLEILLALCREGTFCLVTAESFRMCRLGGQFV